MIRGMTGFGRAQGQAPWGVWVWEARSVNGKSVDIRTNYPPGCDAIDFDETSMEVHYSKPANADGKYDKGTVARGKCRSVQ